jgi:YaiO family outer membrane protein
MVVSLATAVLLAMLAQSPSADRTRAEQLARSGRNAESLALFEHIAAGNPADTEARLWVARLQLRVGRTKEAEAGFRAVVKEHPADVDARIGLGMALTRAGEWNEALAVLREAEKNAGDDNSDLQGALARAYRRAGDDRLALDHFSRARALAPDDPDLVDGFEATAHVYGHSIEVGGFGEGGASDARSGSMTIGVRVHPRLRLDGSARVQRRAGSTDALGGAGSSWRVNRSTTLNTRLVGGSGNTSLPNADLMAEVINYTGAFEVGGSFRGLSFSDVAVVAASPQLAWDSGGRWRSDGRYTYSHSSFDTTGEATGDHSVLLRETWRGWRRVSVTAAYAYGIESFEDLTADRLQGLGAHTMALGLRIRLPSLTILSAAWEHQWRSNDTRMDRFTVSLVQAFP